MTWFSKVCNNDHVLVLRCGTVVFMGREQGATNIGAGIWDSYLWNRTNYRD